MRKMKRGQWIAAVFGLALAGTLTFGVTFDAQAAGRSLIAGEWINMEGGPGVAQWKNEDGTIVIVEFDMLEYQRKHNSKAVKKTLSIPEWLNEEAVSMGVNFSQVLQEALMSKLNISR